VGGTPLNKKIESKRILAGLTIASIIHLLIVFSMNTTFDVPAEPFSSPKDAVYIDFFHNHVPHPSTTRFYFRLTPNYYHERRIDLWYKSLEKEEYLQ